MCLGAALDAHYTSQEAFTRAFQSQFNITPGALHTSRDLEELHLTRVFNMAKQDLITLPTPRQEIHPGMTLAGLQKRYTPNTSREIPALWEAFGPYMDQIPGQADPRGYGAAHDFTENGFLYMAGVEIAGNPDLPQPFETLKIPAGPGHRI